MGRWKTVGTILKVLASHEPDREGTGDLTRRLTFREWNDRANRLANGLTYAGLQKGDRIAMIAHNSVEWMEYYAATAKAGFVCVPVMFRLSPAEYAYNVGDSGARAFIVAEEFVEGANSVRDLLSGVEVWIYLGKGNAPDGYIHYEELMERGSPGEPPVTVEPGDLWTIMYTSGTTGRPKGAMRTHESFTGFFLTNVAAMEFNRNDRGLFVMPMCHVNSIYYAFSIVYAGGASLVYSKASFDPAHFLKTLEDLKVSFTSLVPTHYIMILSLPDEVKKSFDVTSIRKLLCSSAPVRRETKLEILDFFSKSELYEAYGSTEGGKVTLLTPDKQFTKLGSIGRELIGSDLIKLLDEDRNEVPVGQVGELFSNNSSCFTGYWNMPEETRAAFHGEWFSAGDMAYKDEEGYYYLVDRKKNMIITGGENVYPSEVENAVGSHPSVKDVAVIGIPDKKWGERVAAIVVLKEGFEASGALGAELDAHVKDRIAGFKRPKDIKFIKDDEMPRTATGKILHRELRTRYGHWAEQK